MKTLPRWANFARIIGMGSRMKRIRPPTSGTTKMVSDNLLPPPLDLKNSLMNMMVATGNAAPAISLYRLSMRSIISLPHPH
ncbi:hypothetical protein GUJ93_ZPchr0015g6766 [Zizania palustris]|uniref:Uncharacterized protein n=1 Tax=Zizania palustris TaxID=103762 RepID=A0A8J5VSW3_ZIZPA|nr:hypothetical protein GUJ93_ZPchr0015g6766 [Zizania palustris]